MKWLVRACWRLFLHGVLTVLASVIWIGSGAGILTWWNDSPFIDYRPGIQWTIAGGRYVFAIPHESAGRYPHGLLDRLFQEDCVFGFGLRTGSRGFAPAYQKITMIAVPWWFVTLLCIALAVWIARLLEMPIIRAKRGRGFDPVMNPLPLPAAHTGESASSSRAN